MKNKILNRLNSHMDKIHFNEEDHTYLHKDKDRFLTPVSETLAYFKAGMENIPDKYMIPAINRGNFVHNVAEDFINVCIDRELEEDKVMKLLSLIITQSKRYTSFKDEYIPYLVNLIEFLQKEFKDGWKPLKAEQRVFNLSNNMAGSMDLLLYKEDYKYINTYSPTGKLISASRSKEKTFFIKIVDYKTGNLRASAFAQVSLYQFMLKKVLKSLKLPIELSSELISFKDMERK